MVLPKKLFSLLTAQSLVKSEKSEETSVIRDFPFCFIVTMYVEVTFMYSYVCGGHVLYLYVRGGHVLLVTLFLFSFFCSVLVSVLHASLFLSLLAWGVGGGWGCLHITVLVHFVNSAGLSRIYNNTSASGSASALRASAQGLRALRVVYIQL